MAGNERFASSTSAPVNVATSNWLRVESSPHGGLFRKKIGILCQKALRLTG